VHDLSVFYAIKLCLDKAESERKEGTTLKL